MSSNIRLLKTCQECGKEFVAKTTVTKNCSNICAKRAWKRRQREKKIEASIEEEKKIIPQHIKNSHLVNKEILSIKETCSLIGISRPTFYKLVKDGVLKSTKIGSRVFVTKKEINNVFGI